MSAVPWLSVLALDKDEKAAIEKLKTLATSFGAGALAQKVNVGEVVTAMRGEGPAPSWLVKSSEIVRKFNGDPQRRELMIQTLKNAFEANDIEYSTVASLLRKFAPVVNVEPDGKSADELLVETLDTISQNAYSEETNPQYVGMVQCPQCKFTHLV